jgi:hypothetical protein
MKVYLVRGWGGAKDGTRTWDVKAFTSKEKAEELAHNTNLYMEKISKRAEKLKLKGPINRWGGDKEFCKRIAQGNFRKRCRNPYDPFHQENMDLYDNSYSVVELEVEE